MAVLLPVKRFEPISPRKAGPRLAGSAQHRSQVTHVAGHMSGVQAAVVLQDVVAEREPRR